MEELLIFGRLFFYGFLVFVFVIEANEGECFPNLFPRDLDFV